MTQPAPTAWSRADYISAINVKVKEEFEDDFDVASELAKLPELQRIDFDPHPWRAGEAHPGDPTLIFMSFFAGELPGDILAYVYPTAGDPTMKVWRRYTVNRGGGISTVEGMSRDTFVEEIAAEWTTLLAPDEEEEEEEEEETDDAPEEGVPAPSGSPAPS